MCEWRPEVSRELQYVFVCVCVSALVVSVQNKAILDDALVILAIDSRTPLLSFFLPDGIRYSQPSQYSAAHYRDSESPLCR